VMRRLGTFSTAFALVSLVFPSTSGFSLRPLPTQSTPACGVNMSAKRIAVVTGANKGIGLEIARILGKEPNVHCILACRNPALGKQAAAELKSDGCDVVFQPLDIADGDSISKFASIVKQEYGAIDMLVNNAGFAFKGADPTPFSQQARPTLHINYFGTINVCETLTPLLRDGARISNVASMAGPITLFTPPVRARLAAGDLRKEEVAAVAHNFIQDVENGTHREKGWPSTTYGCSKALVTAYTRVLARELKGRNILVNSCCPGYCVTDMTSRRGSRTAAEGAKTPALLALLPHTPDAPTGEFWADGRVRDWAAGQSAR